MICFKVNTVRKFVFDHTYLFSTVRLRAQFRFSQISLKFQAN